MFVFGDKKTLLRLHSTAQIYLLLLYESNFSDFTTDRANESIILTSHTYSLSISLNQTQMHTPLIINSEQFMS